MSSAETLQCSTVLHPGGILPEGWVLSSICDVTQQVPNVRPEAEPKREFGYIDISSICNKTFRILETRRFKGNDAPSRARRPIKPHDVLFSNVRTYLKNVAIVPNGLGADLCSTGFTVLRSNGATDPRFLFLYVITDRFNDLVTPQQTGTHYPATSDRVVMSCPLPLPPMAEQKRIVEKVEELLARVNAARERLARVPAILKRFRQAVLAAACSGRLTADWRSTRPPQDATALLSDIVSERQTFEGSKREAGRLKTPNQSGSPELPDGWVWASGAQLFAWSSGKFLPKKKVRNGPYPVYGGNGVNGHHAEYLVNHATLAIGRVGALCGNVYLTEGRAWVTDNAIYASYVPAMADLKYLKMTFSQSNLNANAGGSGQPFVNQTMLDAVLVPLPPAKEQHEIVRRVEALFKLADAVEKSVAAATARAHKLTQAILAKAFRGELVPSEAELARREGRDYEPASAFLARIQAQRATPDPTKRDKASRKKRPTKANI